jgi:cell division transport system permease protein
MASWLPEVNNEMSDPVSPQRSGALLPSDSAQDRPLFAVAAILVFLACLAAFGAIGAWQAAENWTRQLTNELTVQILPTPDRDSDVDAESAAALIANLPGIISVDARDRAASERLLEPWLGRGELPEDLPVPRLIAVTLDPEAPTAPGAIETLLSDQPYRVIVDDHDRWEIAVSETAHTVRLIALGLLTLLTLAAAAVIVFAARASLEARWDVAEALHLVGAPDRYITALFQGRFFWLGLKSGLTGAVLAGLAATLLSITSGPSSALFFLPRMELSWGTIIIPPLFAFVSGGISAMAARMAVSAELKARWS